MGQGDTVVFHLDTIKTKCYNINQLRHYYGDLYDFDADKPYLLAFLTEHHPQRGHCAVIRMDNRAIITMVHMDNLRMATEDEC